MFLRRDEGDGDDRNDIMVGLSMGYGERDENLAITIIRWGVRIVMGGKQRRRRRRRRKRTWNLETHIIKRQGRPWSCHVMS